MIDFSIETKAELVHVRGCPHGNGSPQMCSQCRGAVPRKVTVDHASVILIDGEPARPFDPGISKRYLERVKRGSKHSHRRSRVRLPR